MMTIDEIQAGVLVLLGLIEEQIGFNQNQEAHTTAGGEYSKGE